MLSKRLKRFIRLLTTKIVNNLDKLVLKHKVILGICSILIYILSCVLVYLDDQMQFRWFEFGLWIYSIFLFWYSFQPRIKLIGNPSGNNNSLLIIIIIAILIRIIFINIYPYNSIGDELRDGGLDTMRIFEGIDKNIFGYGSYESHGKIIPTLTIAFYLIFGNTSLSFKVASCVFSTLSIYIFFIAMKKIYNSKFAFFATIVFMCLPHHLYYARSEIVVIFTSFWTSVLIYILASFQLEKNIKPISLMYIGLISGFALGFHASIRPVILFVFILTIIKILFTCKKIQLKNCILHFMILAVTLLIGFGPRLIKTKPSIIFLTRTVNISSFQPQNNDYNPGEHLTKIIRNSKDSFLIYLSKNSNFHFKEGKSIVPSTLGFLFVIGVIAIFFSKNNNLKSLALLGVLIPVTNSAITNCINCDHRLAPLWHISAIFVGLGIYQIYLLSKNKQYRIFILVIFLLLVSWPVTQFFIYEEANNSMFRHNKKNLYQDFMVSYTIKTIKQNYNDNKSMDLCLFMNKNNQEFFQYKHITQQFEFHLPNFSNIQIHNFEETSDREIWVSPNCQIDNIKLYEKISYCQTYQKFTCPPDRIPIIIYIMYKG